MAGRKFYGMYAGVAALFFAGGLGYSWLSSSDLFAVREFTLSGVNDSRSLSDVKSIVEESVDRNLISLNIDKVRQAVEEISWVRSARVTRVFPNEINIVIERHQAVARTQDEGEFISSEGVVYIGQDDEIKQAKSLPLISCEPNQTMMAVRELPRLQTVVDPLGMRISEVLISFRGSWNLRLVSEKYPTLDIELGRMTSPDLLTRRLRLFVENFEKVSNVLQGYPVRVDARYTNAFAVKWPSDESKAQYKANTGK